MHPWKSGWKNAVETLLSDVRYAMRRLRAAPGFALAALLTLALGIGAATAIFSAVKPILFEPLPYPDADRIVMVVEPRPDGGRNDGTFGMYRELAVRSRSLESIAVLRSWQPTLTGDDHPERLDGQRVSASYFHVLGMRPVVGRDFTGADDRPEAAPVVVISHSLWHARFAGDAGIIGREVALDERTYTVIGVMPASFENVLAPSARVWTTLQYDMSQSRAWGHHLRTVGRLAGATTVEQASRELGTLARTIVTELEPETYPAANEVQVTAAPLQDELTRGVRSALVAVLGAVGLVLIIACVNVTNLLLARGVRRRGELALRIALGASRSRIVRQLLTETLCLALIGGALGMAVAFAGVRALEAMGPPGLPRVAAMEVDAGALAFGFALTAIIALAIGLIPAMQSVHANHRAVLQGGSRRTVGGQRRTRSALVVGEVALALVLLVSSGLLMRSLQRLFAVDTGFDPANLLTVQVQTAGVRFADDEVSDRFFSDVLSAVRRVPGVAQAGLTSQLPLSGDRDEFGVRVAGTTDGNSSFRYSVTAGYMEAMRIPLRLGRMLGDQDRAAGPFAAVINESFARRLFGEREPLGQQVQIGGAPMVYTIVGIVGDIRQASLAVAESDAVYTTVSQWPFADRAMSIVVRSHGDAAALAPAIRDAVWSVDRNQPIVRVATMNEIVAATAAERRFMLMLFEAFALAALVLAAAGIYGVLAGSVAERTREIGVRSALGASRRDILGLVVRQGLILTGVGIAVGIVASAAASRAIGAMLFGISASDPVTYVIVIALLGGVSLVASAVPAWRAARVDPASTLRAE